MNNHQQATLEALLKRPVPRTLERARVESLLVSLGARVVDGRGSRVRFELNGAVATFHRPHPDRHAKPYQLRDARQFIEQAGVLP
ncbi:type II toxin-antitoxin system HicA family toxin [Pseudomonas hunanensis]|uniref:type II toxin-antitoxin system HicA family toxin n=1 Tax=Pseudomonas hunanensis TaxID=1247546 RepID=UPI00381F5479